MLCPMSRRTWTLYLLCWFAGMACGLIASVVPTYLPEIAQTLVKPHAASDVALLGSIVQSVFLFGWVVGGVGLGLVSDLRGRTPVLGLAVITASLLTAGTALVSSEYAFASLRFLSGVCVGASMVISTTLGAEILPDARRPMLMGVLANSYAVGIVGSGLFQSSGIPYVTVASLIALLCLPAALFFVTKQSPSTNHTKQPFGVELRSARKEILIGSVLFGCMLIVVWAAFSWLPTWTSGLFPGSDNGAEARGAVMLFLGGGGILGSLLVGPVVHMIGRVRAMLLCYIAVGVLSAYLYSTVPDNYAPFHITVAAMSIFFGMSQALMAFYIPELFPATVRATSVGICLNIGRILTAFAVLQVGVVAQVLGGFQQALFMTSGVLIIGMVFIAKAPTEIKLQSNEHHSL